MHTIAPYIHTMAARIPLSSMTKVTHPAILPISPRTFGNNVPKSLHKTRRSWWPNVTRANLTVTILDGQPMGPTLKGKEKEVLGAIPRTQALKGVKIAVRDLKDVDKAGGVEGLLVSPSRGILMGKVNRQLSRPSKDFTPFGQKLRAELFRRLHLEREQRLFDQASSSGRVSA